MPCLFTRHITQLNANPPSPHSFLWHENPPDSGTLPGATGPDQGVYSMVLCGRGSSDNGEMPCQFHM